MTSVPGRIIQRLFGGSPAKDAAGSSQFAQSQNPTSADRARSRNAPRRELVKLSLREVMRKHGIPSDWIECRALSVLTHQHKAGMHVQFLVRQADHQLLHFVHALQESFWEEIVKTDPQAREWLFSVGWEFYGKSVRGFSPLADPTAWQDTGDTHPAEVDPLPPQLEREELASDLQALQALMSTPAELADLPPAAPRRHRGDI